MPGAQQTNQASPSVHAVLVVDEVPLLARGVAAVLQSHADLRVHRATPDPARLTTAAIECGAAVVVVGVSAGANAPVWLQACARLRRRQPGVRLVVLVDPGTGLDVGDVVRAGAIGMLPRTADEDQLLAAVKAAVHGRGWVAPEVAGAMMQALSSAISRGEARPTAGGLSTRELDVLRLVAEGLSNRDVASRLHISENTVKNHLRSVHDKLGVSSRTEAVITAVRSGLLGEIGPRNDSGEGRWAAVPEADG